MDGKQIIMLVEDNPDDVALTLRALKKNNIVNEVVVACDGAEALAMLADRSRRLPTVVLLDLKLSKVDGLEVLRQLRAEERTRLLPVVVLTSSNEEQDRYDSYRFGANSFIRKPIGFDELATAVGHLQIYWLLLNEPPPESTSAAA